jgi:hypothetical protein
MDDAQILKVTEKHEGRPIFMLERIRNDIMEEDGKSMAMRGSKAC